MQAFDFAIATQLGQAAISLILALLLWVFLRSRRHRYLRQLALAFTALGLYLGLATMALATSQYGNPLGAPRHAFSVSALALLFPHLVWLSLGIHGGIRQRHLSLRFEQRLVGGAGLLGIGVGLVAIWLALSDHSSAAHALRFTLPYVAAGLTYLWLAGMVFRHRSVSDAARVSPILAVLAFAAFGAHLLYAAFLGTHMVLSGEFIVHSQLVGLVGLMLLMLIALSVIIWLLESEQQRATSARSQARVAEQRLHHFRRHDTVTGLPNRQQIQELLTQELDRLQTRGESRVAVLALGIHRFRVVSEAFGWDRTEDMMRDLAGRILQKMPDRFILGRSGERDFVVLMPNIRRRDTAIDHAKRIIAHVRQPIDHKGRELFLRVSGGLSLAPDDSKRAEQLLEQADKAQLQAATIGEDLLLHRASGAGPEPWDMLQVEAELRRAQANKEFRLYFQPLISIRQRRIAGFEALLRWEHPERGLLNPGHFLEDATTLGILDELEDQIFEGALKQLADWQNDLALAPVSVSINVSPQRFVQPDLPDKLAEMCRQHGISPGYLDIEITENAAIGDFEAGLDTIQRLRQHGIKVSLDDFGTGYSSLAHLQRLRVDYVKLDRSFVAGIEDDPRQLALTRAVVELIHSLGMQVLAEGIETKTQLGHMIQCRVDFVQGFLLGLPQPPEHYRELLEEKYITAF